MNIISENQIIKSFIEIVGVFAIVGLVGYGAYGLGFHEGMTRQLTLMLNACDDVNNNGCCDNIDRANIDLGYDIGINETRMIYILRIQTFYDGFNGMLGCVNENISWPGYWNVECLKKVNATYPIIFAGRPELIE